MFTYEKVVKTADGLSATGLINDAAVHRVVDALKEMQMKVDFNAAPLRAVTTEAVRRASNSQEVLAKIEQETGVTFEIISGEEEARLTLFAVQNRLKKLFHDAENFVVVDIGGGSTEIICNYGDTHISKSFPVGIVTIAQKYGSLEKIKEALPEHMLEMQQFFREVTASKGRPDSFVATAGTPTTVAAMKLGMNYASYDAVKINGTPLEIGELEIYLSKLLSLPFEERELAVGTGRSDLIAAGILIYKQLYKILCFETCVVIDDGLREGVALEECIKTN
jgi:exopolyphosphatase/guanosine-5'-triphosphate,3'-diphosphate pyrophosphatase